MTKVLALFSGGLDSILAVKLIQAQKIDVIGISFTSPFFSADMAQKAALDSNLPLQIIDITNELLEIIKAPKHGYGRFMNPCIDCHALMARKAGSLLGEMGASFVVTGEVLGERPKSQNKDALGVVAKQSGLKGYLLRPLSAKLLEPTVPEEKGLVDREKLMGIRGRSRKPQLALAKQFGISDFPTPAGGCLLTEEKISLRLRDLLEEKENPSSNDLLLLKWGRHFRSSEGIKIVVSRQESENSELVRLLQPDDLMFQVAGFPGPRVLVRGDKIGKASLLEAALLAARYSKARGIDEVAVFYRSGNDAKSAEISVKRPLAAIESEEHKISLIDSGNFKRASDESKK